MSKFCIIDTDELRQLIREEVRSAIRDTATPNEWVDATTAPIVSDHLNPRLFSGQSQLNQIF